MEGEPGDSFSTWLGVAHNLGRPAYDFTVRQLEVEDTQSTDGQHWRIGYEHPGSRKIGDPAVVGFGTVLETP